MSNERFVFRIWDKSKKCYMDERVNLFEYNELLILLAVNPDLEVEQCTGMKDRNGKLIFEGDKVSIPNNYPKNTTTKYYVIWDRKEWQLMTRKPHCDNPDCPHQWTYWRGVGHTNLKDFANCKVVGTIHD